MYIYIWKIKRNGEADLEFLPMMKEENGELIICLTKSGIAIFVTGSTHLLVKHVT